ncbi:MAG: hypothetical protein QXG00_03075 [Candidatus Woesearchaeota archaeon]
MKRKYTKEQLQFYFNKLMLELNRIPTEEDAELSKYMPSLTVYVQRFGSWKKVQELWGNRELNKKTCLNCSKEIKFIKKSKLFCSRKCAKQYKTKQKLLKLKPKKCKICKEEYNALMVKNFKKSKICNKKECREKYRLIVYMKKLDMKKTKNNIISNKIYNKIIDVKENKCHYCDFNKILKIRLVKGKTTNKKIIQSIKNNRWDFLIVCPNHYEMLDRKMM